MRDTAPRFLAAHQQMHVIAHQHPAMHRYRLRGRRHAQRVEVGEAVVIVGECGTTIHATLGDVQRDAGEFQWGAAHA